MVRVSCDLKSLAGMGAITAPPPNKALLATSASRGVFCVIHSVF
jgi:hypothetical protein